MKIDIEELDTCTKQLKIEIPKEVFLQEEENAYRELGKKVKISGFRKGKIPRSYLKNLYQDRVKNDVLNKIIPESYYKAVEEKALRPVGPPKLENIAHEENSPVTFTATIDIIPPYEIKSYEGMEITKKIVKVTDKDIERELGYIKDRYATFEEVSDRTVQVDDLVMINFNGFIDGTPIQEKESVNFPLLIGSNTLMESFENGFIGMNKNDEKEIPVTYPADHINKTLAGKDVLFKVKVNEIKLKKLPETTDEFIKNEMGKDMTLEQLKEEIRERQEKREKETAGLSLKADIFNKLIELNPIEIPEALIEDQINYMIEDFKNKMRGRGIKEDSLNIERDKFREDAEKGIKGELIQQKITEMEKVTLDADEIEKELEKAASEMNMPKGKFKISLQKNKTYDNFLNNALRKKTMEAVLSKLKIKEITVDKSEIEK